ncbi:MAG TPA: hypothetical protein VLA61_12305 [Ideonella sp.]|nr:hypothetical protein [Ideonella sp.]HSI49045.1 hypothetical protein [Ideonella sp.]
MPVIASFVRHHERPAAHLDGIAVAGEYGDQRAQAMLELAWLGGWSVAA